MMGNNVAMKRNNIHVLHSNGNNDNNNRKVGDFSPKKQDCKNQWAQNIFP